VPLALRPVAQQQPQQHKTVQLSHSRAQHTLSSALPPQHCTQPSLEQQRAASPVKLRGPSAQLGETDRPRVQPPSRTRAVRSPSPSHNLGLGRDSSIPPGPKAGPRVRDRSTSSDGSPSFSAE
jgi:hypothetical protein